MRRLCFVAGEAHIPRLVAVHHHPQALPLSGLHAALRHLRLVQQDRPRVTTIRRRIKDSQKQEARGAKQHGGAVRPGSGSKASAKGDVRVPRNPGASVLASGTLIEYKRTEGKGIRLTTVVLEKIRREALLEGRRPLLGLELGGRDYVVLPVEDFLDLEERAGARQ